MDNGSKKRLGRWGALLLAAAIGLTAAQPAAKADVVWDHWQAAEAAVAAGNRAAAVEHWKYLADTYAGLGEWENAALFCGKLDAYYDETHDYEQAIHYYELENEYWLKAGKDWGASKLQRAEQLRTTIELYVSETDNDRLTAQSAPARGGLSKFEPEYGAYFGIYSELDPKVGNMFAKNEAIYGKKHAIYLAYTQWGKPFPSDYVQRVKQAGGAIQIAWEPAQGLDVVTDGAYLRKWAQDAKAAGIPIFLRYASEMNGAWVPWNGDPQKYIEKFRMLHDVFAQEAPNVAMVWSPGDVPAYSIDPYYPGDDYVDWVGVSLYTEPYGNGDPNDNMTGTSPVERLQRLYDTYASRKPMMLSETGIGHYSHATNESFQDWAILDMQRLYEVMPYKYPRLKAITYFNVDQGTDKAKNDYMLDDSQPIQDVYSKLISSPYFLSEVKQGAKPAEPAGYVKAGAAVTFASHARIVPFIKIPDVYISKVEYAVNGRIVSAQTDAPFSLELDAGDVPDGSVLTVRAYNKAGALAAEKSFPLGSRISVTIDGKPLAFEQPPVILDGSTLAPVRAVFEAMGATVSYDAATKTVTGRKGDTSVVLVIGNKQVTKNGAVQTLDAPAQLVNGYTIVPARFVGEAFGGTVEWDGRTRTVRIKTK